MTENTTVADTSSSQNEATLTAPAAQSPAQNEIASLFAHKPVRTAEIAESDSTNEAESAAENDTTDVQPPAEPTYKLTINGKEKEVTAQEYHKYAQKAAAADQAFKEAADLRKQAETFATMLRDNPLAVLQQLGIDTVEMSRSVLEREIRQMEMSPEELELEQYRAQIQQHKQEMERQQHEEVTRQEQALTQKMAERMNTEIIGALETYNIPNDEYSVSLMVDIMRENVQQDLGLTWDDAAKLVDDKLNNDLVRFLSRCKDDAELVRRIGADNVKRILKHSTKDFQKPAPTKQPAPTKKPAANDIASLFQKTNWRK